MEETDILIAGAGIAGLTAAARLASLGLSVTLADPQPPLGDDPDRAPDLRTTAFLQPAIDSLTRAGAWDAMEADAAPLRVMRLIDAGGRERAPRKTADFDAAELAQPAFGLNIANSDIRVALERRVAELGVSRIAAGAAATHLRGARRVVRLAGGAHIAARLVVAADGRDSTLRQLAGIKARRWHYGQKALVFAVHHHAPHDGVSTEIHRTGGPLTLVPMPDRSDGETLRPTSAVVWMVPGPRAAQLAALDDTALAAEITAETMGLFGPLTLARSRQGGPTRAAWPIISQLAHQLTAPRLALIAEAAHVVPPIGAQGLNTSIKDIEALAELIEGAADPGDRGLLDRYAQSRWPDMAMRVGGVDILNRFAQAEPQPLRDLRRAGLAAIHGIAPLRRLAMRTGLGL